MTTLFEQLMVADSIETLSLVWANDELTIAEKARLVAMHHPKSRMTLEGSARMSGATTAVIQALMELATLDDDLLEEISNASPPPTTWFLFAGASRDSIRAGIEALRNQIPANQSELLAVYDAMRKSVGPTQNERIGALSGKTIGHLANKAKQYNVTNPKSLQFLVSVARQRKTGKVLTEKQLSWLKSILLDLVQSGVVRADSQDGDEVECMEVLSALGLD